ncbi:MAG: valine--tRNA ligase [Candidatus Micrarchaeota archaeon]|nr:valine--tRNA ligase [Candidatus Micrarchaeota archaeon]
MDERFNFKEVEQSLAEFWEEERVYGFDPKSKKEVFSIDTPPPTISGSVHIGHVFSYSQADFIARYKRMRGFSVFYPFGFDNNGLPTELLVEKLNKTTAEREGREKFIAKVEAVTKEYEALYRRTFGSVGISVDWTLLYTTISKDTQRISQLSFLELNRMGRVYRKETPTIWCPKEGTALSQMELKDKMLKSKFVTIRFSDDVVIATTRPELLPACVAIFVNPDDKKNSTLVGKKVKVPIFGQEVKVMADARVDPTKGTGVVMCCTFGDLTDIEWYKAYGLPLRIEISEKGKMLNKYFGGIGIKDARQKMIEDLKSAGYVLAEKEIEHNVNVHERCGTEIEFLVKMQWYVRYLDMKEVLIEQGRKLRWHPDFMAVRYENWIKGLQWDWSISRQRYYGIPFPVWYCKKCGEPIMADEKRLPVNPLVDKPGSKCAKCGSLDYVPETDILDTWATSSLTPLINAKWKGGDDYMHGIYPMSLRPQAHDIISFWLFTTVVKCYLHTKKLPWKDALISGHGLDSHGKPMHKSEGNIIEPSVVLEKYGADALRHWASLSRLGDDASFQDKDVLTGFKFVNKMWNVARFIEQNKAAGSRESRNVMDRWIRAKAAKLVKACTERFDEYDYAGAKRSADEFFWFFSNNYLEFVKYRIYGNDKDAAASTVMGVYLDILKLLAPFMPYITEKIYQELYRKKEGSISIHLSEWPKADAKHADGKAEALGDKVYGIISQVRQWKHERKAALNSEIKELVISEKLEDGEDDIKGAMNIKKISIGKGEIPVGDTGISIGIQA